MEVTLLTGEEPLWIMQNIVIYTPQSFYDRIIDRNLCVAGQNVLDLGTGTGVLPRNLYRYGATWTATDISENQIEQAKLISEGMDIDYYTVSTKKLQETTAEERKVNNVKALIRERQCFLLDLSGESVLLYCAVLRFRSQFFSFI